MKQETAAAPVQGAHDAADAAENFPVTVDFERIGEQMLDATDTELTAEFFKALSDATRVKILNALQVQSWLCVSDLAALLSMSNSAVSHQLSYLKLNKLVKVRRDGKHSYYALDDDHVEKVLALTISHIRE